jgi:hypothetical protein
MRRFGICFVALFAILAAPHLARAGDDEPAVVLRVKSLGTVLQNLKMLASLVGQEQAATDIQALINAKAGKKGLEGIDMDRPVGAYVKFGADITDTNLAVLIPVADQKTFITLLENLDAKPTKGKDGIYTLQAKDAELLLRFANKYAYISFGDRDNLSDKRILDPVKVLAGPKDSLLSASIRIDKLPDGVPLIILSQLDEQIEAAIDNAPKEDSEAVKAFRKASLKQISKTVADVLKEGKAARVDVNLDEAKKDISVKISLTAKKGTDLATTIKNAAAGKSPFAGLLPKDAAFRGSIDIVFPDGLRSSFSKVIDEATKKGLTDIENPAKRAQAKQLIDAIMPTVQTGELDAFFGVAGPVKDHYTLLAAVRVKDGDKLGTVVHDLIAAEMKNMSATEKAKIKLNADSAGGVKIHTFALPPDPKTGKVLEDIPGDPNLHVAFRKDAVFFAIGPTAMTTIKEAIGSQQPGSAPVALFDLDFGRLAPVLAKSDEQKALAKKLFAGKDSHIRVAIEGGEALTLQVNVGLEVLEFLAKTGEKQ